MLWENYQHMAQRVTHMEPDTHLQLQGQKLRIQSNQKEAASWRAEVCTQKEWWRSVKSPLNIQQNMDQDMYTGEIAEARDRAAWKN